MQTIHILYIQSVLFLPRCDKIQICTKTAVVVFLLHMLERQVPSHCTEITAVIRGGGGRGETTEVKIMQTFIFTHLLCLLINAVL